jgi:hypothetical protein
VLGTDKNTLLGCGCRGRADVAVDGRGLERMSASEWSFRDYLQ